MKHSTEKLLSILCAASLSGASAIAFAGCSSKDEGYTAMQVDLNPSVEFILDKDNKVASVTALNDDGAVILSGEAFIGKSAEDAVTAFVEISAETGYLVKGSATEKDGEITVSVSGNADAAQKLYESVEKKASAAAEKYGAAIAKGEALKTEALRKTVKICYPELTDEQIAAMSDKELTEKLAESRKETEKLLSEAMREAYYKAKAYHVSFAQSEAFKNIVTDTNAAYQALMAGYQKGIETLQSAIASIEDVQYTYFISEDSNYQKAVASVLEQKKAVLAQRAKVAELEDGLEKTAAQVILTQKEALLTGAETALETSYQAATAAFAVAENTVTLAVTALENIQKALPNEISSMMTEKAAEIEQKVNEAKDGFFAEFETQYTAAIKAYNDQAAKIKAEMKAEN